MWRSRRERGVQQSCYSAGGYLTQQGGFACLLAIFRLELSRYRLRFRGSRSARRAPSICDSLQLLGLARLGLTLEARHGPHIGSLTFSRAAWPSRLTAVNSPLTVNSLVTKAVLGRDR
jgi:hypothetical protein